MRDIIDAGVAEVRKGMWSILRIVSREITHEMVNEPVMRASLWSRDWSGRAWPGATAMPKLGKAHPPRPEYFAEEFAPPIAVVSQAHQLASTLINISTRPAERLIFLLAQATHAYSRIKRSINHILQGLFCRYFSKYRVIHRTY
jgi:hypothetical protein